MEKRKFGKVGMAIAIVVIVWIFLVFFNNILVLFRLREPSSDYIFFSTDISSFRVIFDLMEVLLFGGGLALVFKGMTDDLGFAKAFKIYLICGTTVFILTMIDLLSYVNVVTA